MAVSIKLSRPVSRMAGDVSVKHGMRSARFDRRHLQVSQPGKGALVRAEPSTATRRARRPQPQLAMPSATPALRPNLPQRPLNARCDISRGPLLPLAESWGFFIRVFHGAYFSPRKLINANQLCGSSL